MKCLFGGENCILYVNTMWSEIVEYLKDPSLVAQFQTFFGVKTHYTKSSKDYSDKNSHSETRDIKSHKFKHNTNNCSVNNEESKLNGYTTVERKSNNVTKTQPQQSSTLINSDYTIKNYFWYYLFLFGTQLGDEIFYSTFIPFWFWNIDGAVGRRVVLVWAVIMTIGQILKDVICWPRPACPPAVRLQSKWAEEYGMPSTHAMIGISIPFSVVLFTMNRYIYHVFVGWTIAFLWCTLVCMSRLYLGMHTVLDILAGLILAVGLMIILIPLVDITDYYILSNIWALAILIAISIAVIVYYPCSKKWTPTRGDTTMVVSVTTGIHLGAWLNYNTGIMLTPPNSPPYQIIWPSYTMFGCMILRTILGFCCILATRTICKSLSYKTMCAILNINSKDLMKSQNYSGNKNKVIVDLVHKYLSCFMIGVNTVYFLPNFFTMIGIERPTFYTEI
ncbi:sphingosine-1-phosphate phosphatase 2-like [Osmia bicornis bicornis]|uniref:sphingosine-1-phosphate phosphatase 2-like n=1 Tax=Osmia bicornis bicornis TaxID=1437191 RepID=UPI0010F4B25E|nr:sphingosine-1-phosphate phosphatase 2-like [Osmia bicornis bicornis]XP_029034493.1 sphingosine-1-phosphate phosphatase 2-like [Osmia bicornis bicornis]